MCICIVSLHPQQHLVHIINEAAPLKATSELSRSITLQVILEGLFDKIKAQSSVIKSLTSDVEKLRGDEEVDPVDRIRLLERRMNEMFGEPGTEPRLSPFKQQELIDKVDYLEATVAAQADELCGMKLKGKDVRRDQSWSRHLYQIALHLRQGLIQKARMHVCRT